MNLNDRNLSLRMRGEDVALLQRELQHLGAVIDPGEVTDTRFGTTTRDAVQRFQREHALEPTGVVDEETARLINAEVDRLGRPPAHAALVVRGAVINPDGSAVARAIVKAVDIALRTETPLGEAPTGADGKYEIGYQREQLQPEGKVAADLIVRAYDEAGNEIARSELLCRAPAEAVVDLVVGNQPLRGPSEYDTLVATVRPYLGDTALADLEREDVQFLVCSAEVDALQLATLIVANRLARNTSLPDWLFYALGRQGVRLQLEAMVLLRRKALKDALNAASDTNVVRTPSGEDILETLLDQLQAVLIRTAFDEREGVRFSIGALLGTSLVSRDLQEAFLARYLARPESPEEFWKGLREDERFSDEAVESLALTLLLGRLTRFRLPLLAQLKRLRESGELRSFRDLARLDRGRWREMLVAAAENGLELPDDIAGETLEDRKEHYITSLRAPIESLFPSDSLRRALAAAPDTEPNLARFISNASDLDLYWTNIDAYLGEHRDSALSGIAASDHEAVIARVKRVQRLLRLTRRADQVRVLETAGYDSALAIARTPKRRFQKHFVEVTEALKDTLDDVYMVTAAPNDVDEQPRTILMMMNSADVPEKVAGVIQANAAAQSTANLHQAVELNTLLGSWPWSIGGPEDLQKKLKEDAYKEFPDLETLFGAQSFCECEHCRSVYSPAAYLVDLLHELDELTSHNGTLDYDKPRDAPTPIGALLARRPDIVHISLTCENTNTALPYIDLVNEALESFVESHLDGGGNWIDTMLPIELIQARDTGKTTAQELRAVPQYVVPEVYAHLARKAVYPMTLPFHRPLEVTRTYVGQLGTSRATIMEVFRTAGGPSQAALVLERLGMCPAQYQIIAATASTDPPFDASEVDGLKDLWNYYGYDSAVDLAELLQVPALLHRTGIAFDELVAILKTRFVNPKLYAEAEATADTTVVKIQFPSGLTEDACDVSKMTLANLDPAGDIAFAHAWLDRLHRFVRLWRALGWTVADVDRALATVGGLNEAGLERLAALKELASTLRQPVASLLVLWSDLDTWGVEITTDPITNVARVTHREESLYAEVFLNRAVVQDEKTRQVFESILIPPSPATLDNQVPSIAAALAITADDIERIRTHEGLAENAPLSLAVLSTFCRYAILSKALGIRVRDLIALLRLVPESSMDPFESKDPRPALEFVRIVRSIQASEFSVPLLNYLFRDEAEPTRHPAPTRALVKTTLEALQNGLAAIHQELLVAGQLPVDVLRASLELAVGSELLQLQVPQDIERALAVLDPRQTTFEGDDLTPQARKDFVKTHFSDFLADPEQTLFGTVLPDPDDAGAEDRFLENVEKVLDALLPWLRHKLRETLVVDTMADAMGVELATMRRLLKDVLDSTDAQQSGSALEYLLSLVDEKGVPIDLQLEEDPAAPPTLMVYRVFKAAAYVNGLGMTEPELGLFTGPSSPVLTFNPNTALDFDLNELPIAGPVPPSSLLPDQLFEVWRALRAFSELRDALPRSEKTLVDYFLASASDRPAILEEATGWDAKQADAVAQAFGGPSPPNTLRELIRLQQAMSLLKRVGATPPQMFVWAEQNPDHALADEIVQTVKARYEHPRWLEVARGLNDPLREQQRDALVAFLIPRLKGAPFPIRTANDLLDYFLLDVEMSSCMLTSRIKQAISSVQLFVQRCLLNLEPAVSPDEIDPERWEWMKHYRIWEANRKVFLYPETYILPELRDDKTPLFKELETELLQNELTEETIEQAFVSYLYKLDEVARLDIRGFCREEQDDEDIYHVFGRTWNPPYVHYYRRGVFEKDATEGEWSPWERIDIDVQGDHLIPTLWNGRLLLFWPLFDRKPHGTVISASQFHVRMASAERERGKWTKKALSEEAVLCTEALWDSAPEGGFTNASSQGVFMNTLPVQARYLFVLTPEGERLRIDVGRYFPINVAKHFVNAGRDGFFTTQYCGGKISARPSTGSIQLLAPLDSRLESQRLSKIAGPLAISPFFWSKPVLGSAPNGFTISVLSGDPPDFTAPYSFFFHDGPAGSQTYFARPVQQVTGQPVEVLTEAAGGVVDTTIQTYYQELGLGTDQFGPYAVHQLADIPMLVDV
jgi:hypothetical protein